MKNFFSKYLLFSYAVSFRPENLARFSLGNSIRKLWRRYLPPFCFRASRGLVGDLSRISSCRIDEK